MTAELFLAGLPETLRRDAERLFQDLAGASVYARTLLFEALAFVSEVQAPEDLKLLARVVAEMRRGIEVFRPYKHFRKAAMFGSARIPPSDARWRQMHDCAAALKDAGFMVITGGGMGLMHAANAGAGRAHSFGININLPLEQHPNPIVDGSPRHFYCQYFFTRKLFFLKEADAVVLGPGGFGTLDEAFETLTLVQTGRNPPIPIVLLDAPGDDYWGPFVRSWLRRLVDDGLISPDDQTLIFHTDNVAAAVDHITSFYLHYHSFRYVGNHILLRMLNPLSEEGLERLNAEFSDSVEGRIEQVFRWPASDDPETMHLPRLKLRLDRRRMNVLPHIIRRANALIEHSIAEAARAKQHAASR